MKWSPQLENTQTVKNPFVTSYQRIADAKSQSEPSTYGGCPLKIRNLTDNKNVITNRKWGIVGYLPAPFFIHLKFGDYTIQALFPFPFSSAFPFFFEVKFVSNGVQGGIRWNAANVKNL